ncbi:transposase [Cryomorpha ignava]|uniref:transposase n=1 Tax=Cryomorpha ignava TaxID=101383 RepID=UPI0019536E2A|nr:transposase [Cryomorpha ignava]
MIITTYSQGMIPKAKCLKLIEIYFYVCARYDEELKYQCERFSNNKYSKLTDQEIMTIYMFTALEEQRTKLKHRFAHDYLRDWFPDLGSYAAFNNRINSLSGAFRRLGETLITEFRPSDCSTRQSLLDSMPIVVCSGKRGSRVAAGLVDKSYCSTKRMWYHGLKLHALGFRREGKMPFPEQVLLTPASENDLNVFKQAWAGIEGRCFFGDKIYTDKPFFSSLENDRDSTMRTPVRYKRADRVGKDVWQGRGRPVLPSRLGGSSAHRVVF